MDTEIVGPYAETLRGELLVEGGKLLHSLRPRAG